MVLDNVGLADSDAGRILLTRGAKEGALPFDFATDPEMRDKWFRANVRETLVDPREATFWTPRSWGFGKAEIRSASRRARSR